MGCFRSRNLNRQGFEVTGLKIQEKLHVIFKYSKAHLLCPYYVHVLLPNHFLIGSVFLPLRLNGNVAVFIEDFYKIQRPPHSPDFVLSNFLIYHFLSNNLRRISTNNEIVGQNLLGHFFRNNKLLRFLRRAWKGAKTLEINYKQHTGMYSVIMNFKKMISFHFILFLH